MWTNPRFTFTQFSMIFWIISFLIFSRRLSLKFTKYCVCSHIELGEQNDKGEYLYSIGLREQSDDDVVFYSYVHILHDVRFTDPELFLLDDTVTL